MTQPFDLNLRHLRAIPLIVRRGSMSAAAQAAGLSQPALTQGLSKIERQLDARLFERRPGGLTNTTEGRLFAARIQAAFTHLATGARPGARSGRGFSRPEWLMTATQARAFLALADAGSFVEAARVTGWSQPAIHRAVRDLELLGAAALIERRGRGVVLTEDGRRLARGIRLAASELAAGITELSPDRSLAGRIVVGAMPLSRAQVLPAALAALIREAPRAKIDVIEGSWRELVEPLRDGVIDMMIGALRDPPPAGLVQLPLFDDRLVVVARAGHPILAAPNPGLADLSSYPWIVGSPGAPLRAHWDAMFGASQPSAPIECGSVMINRGILLDSDCLALMSPDQIALEVRSGLLAIIDPPPGGLLRTIGVTVRDNWRPATLQARFMDLLHEHGRSTLPKNG